MDRQTYQTDRQEQKDKSYGQTNLSNRYISTKRQELWTDNHIK